MTPHTRRSFLADCGLGFTGLALGAMLYRDGIARAESGDHWTPPNGRPHFPPRAKRVIWLFMCGGVSHVESFDPKPELTKYAGKTIAQTPHKAVLDASFVKDNVRVVAVGNDNGNMRHTLYPLQVGYRKRGRSGIEVSDWWPHVGDCIDEVAVVRSMWTTDNCHGAALQFHTGRHQLDGLFPTIGSWIHYGLGSLNDNLPQFLVFGTPPASGPPVYGSDYLGPLHTGVPLRIDPKEPLPYASSPAGVLRREQANEHDLLQRLNQLTAMQYPSDDKLTARIKSYELAFRMQTSVPAALRFDDESEATKRLYGIDQPQTRDFGQHCLAARRLAERGVRFIQILHQGNGGAGAWDAHSNLKSSYTGLCAAVDKPIAGLLKDLKQRGLLDDTIVVWATEFGRTPGQQGGTGRDHHPFAFSVWLAGAGIKKGVVHGATDELGFHAVEHRHYVTDIHATVLQLLGLDPRKLEIPGRKRLEIDFGQPIREIMA
jgi:hypothetical protein